MTTELATIATQLHKARLAQHDAKKVLLDASREYHVTRARAYLRYLGKDGHYKAQAQATADSAVIRAKEVEDEAELAHYLAWTESNRPLTLLSIERWGEDLALVREEWCENQPN